jgi:hypothetical protein
MESERDEARTDEDTTDKPGTDSKQRRRDADLDAATQPASGAPVASAFAGASLAADDDEGSETEAALKRAESQGAKP